MHEDTDVNSSGLSLCEACGQSKGAAVGGGDQPQTGEVVGQATSGIRQARRACPNCDERS